MEQVKSFVFDPKKAVAKANVTLPLLKVKDGTDYYVKMLTKMAVGKPIPDKKVEQTNPETGVVETVMVKQTPPTLAQVINLEDGKSYQMIFGAVMNKELNEAYPADSYVGKCFAFSTQRVDGKRYKVPQIVEIEDPTGNTGEAASTGEGTGEAASTGEGTGEKSEEAPAAAPAPAAGKAGKK